MAATGLAAAGVGVKDREAPACVNMRAAAAALRGSRYLRGEAGGSPEKITFHRCRTGVGYLLQLLQPATAISLCSGASTARRLAKAVAKWMDRTRERHFGGGA
jgi:hypothetical protein